MNQIIFVTGASGSGKTTIVKAVDSAGKVNFSFHYFDSMGVPSVDEMIERYGSSDEWQRMATNDWVRRIKEEYLPHKPTLLDGQMRLAYIDEACKRYDIKNYQIILFDCDDAERKKRLVQRGHPDLANENMMNWAKYLRNEANKNERAVILDTSGNSLDASITDFLALI